VVGVVRGTLGRARALSYGEARTARARPSLWTRWRLWLTLAAGDAPAPGEPAHPTTAAPLARVAHAATADTPEDFEAFFRRYHVEIFGYLWRMAGEEQAAYDLSQETFLRAWRHYAQVRSYEHPQGWLFRVATHVALNYLKQRQTAARVLTALPDDPDAALGAATSDHATQVADVDQVGAVLLGLAPRPRSVLVLHDLYGLSSQEVARALGMTHAAAKMMLCRAREQFRVRYLRQEDDA
jgi:RNA polymerase sigma-70 factor (ECF subfamily)